jgi:hypothetical protein
MNAVAAVNNGNSFRVAARMFAVQKSTVYSRLQKLKKCANYTKYEGCRIFTNDEEEVLEGYLQEAAKINYGLTQVRARKLAYDYAEINNIKIPPPWISHKSAGMDWMKSFMDRHKNLSLCRPVYTSKAPASAFNITNVGVFFSNITEIMSKHHFEAKDIVNIDETELTTHNSQRGELVTFVGIITAAGRAIPPAFVFPRVNFNKRFLIGAPTSSLGLAHKTGWMTAELFLDVLKHIQTFTKCSVEQPILLVLDNHSSRTSITSIQFCRSHGIILLAMPPGCSYRMQPLNCGVYEAFKARMKVLRKKLLRKKSGEHCDVIFFYVEIEIKNNNGEQHKIIMKMNLFFMTRQTNHNL